MTNLHETLIPGIVFIVLGMVLLLRRQTFVQGFSDAHDRFWKGILGVKRDFGREEEWLGHKLLITLGCAFIAGGALLIYRYFQGLQ